MEILFETRAGQRFVPRRLTEQKTTSEKGNRSGGIEEFFPEELLVVLGNPGSGKTELLRFACEQENGVFLTVREFLALPTSEFVSGLEPLYLDVLDEVRATKATDKNGVLDQIVSKLIQIGRPKVRLSCRATEWMGSLDTSLLHHAATSKKVCSVVLQPLSPEGIQDIVKDRLSTGHQGFIEKAKEKQIDEWLQSPQTLNLLMAAVGNGGWPQTRYELFDRACDVFAAEVNPAHEVSSFGSTSTESIRKASEYLSAIALISDGHGFALRRARSGDGFSFVGSFKPKDIPRETLEAALSRQLFKAEEDGRFVPVHRTIAEFQAAQEIVRLIDEGLPVGRILAIIAPSKGGVPTELAGLWGWLASSGNRVGFLETAPMECVLWGDPSRLDSEQKTSLVKAIAKRVYDSPKDFDPYNNGPSFAPLFVSPLRDQLIELFEAQGTDFRLAATLLAGYRYAPTLEGLDNILASIILKPGSEYLVKYHALRAFCHHYSDQAGTLRSFLEGIETGKIEDIHDELRGRLLRHLVPEHLELGEILENLLPRQWEVGSAYAPIFLGRDIFEIVRREDLPRFLDGLSSLGLPDTVEEQIQPDEINRYWSRIDAFLSQATLKSIEAYDPTIKIARLYSWLGIHDKNRWSYLQGEERELLVSWLAGNPAIHSALLRHAITEYRNDESAFPVFPTSDFIRRIPADLPPGAGWIFLEAAEEEQDSDLCLAFVRVAVQLSQSDDREEEPQFEDISSNVIKKTWKDAERSLAPQQNEIARTPLDSTSESEPSDELTAVRLSFAENIAAIEAGDHFDWLFELAITYLNLRRKQEFEALDHRGRIEALIGSGNWQIARSGLIASVEKNQFVSLETIGSSIARKKCPNRGFIVNVGLALRWQQDQSIEGWDDSWLKYGLAYHVACCPSENIPSWLEQTFANKADLCVEVLHEIWRPSVQTPNTTSLTGQSLLTKWPVIGRAVAIKLLQLDLLCSYRVLLFLLEAGLRNISDREGILKLCQERLGAGDLRPEHRLCWLGIGFLLDARSYQEDVLTESTKDLSGDSNDQKQAVIFQEAWSQMCKQPGGIAAYFSDSAVQTMIIAFSKAYPHTEIHKNGYGPFDKAQVPAWVRSLINYLGARTDDGAQNLLTGLLTHQGTAHWHETLRQTLADQARLRTDQEYHSPSASEVGKVLNNEDPVKTVDLWALLVDTIKGLGLRIRHGSEDAYKFYWNTDQWGRPTEPRVENVCRDLLMHQLRDVLKSGITVDRETQLADQKRTDLWARFGKLAVPIECKVENNSDLWTAVSNQLIPRYSINPEAEGFGILLTFWFGRCSEIANHPDGIEHPTSPEELELELRKTIPSPYQSKIQVICLDLTRPEVSFGHSWLPN